MGAPSPKAMAPEAGGGEGGEAGSGAGLLK